MQTLLFYEHSHISKVASDKAYTRIKVLKNRRLNTSGKTIYYTNEIPIKDRRTTK